MHLRTYCRRGVRPGIVLPSVISGADPHVMVPGYRERPENNRSENCLPNRQRNNIAIATEEPRQRRPADERQRHQDWIRPVARRKDHSCEQRARPSIAYKRHHAIIHQ